MIVDTFKIIPKPLIDRAIPLKTTSKMLSDCWISFTFVCLLVLSQNSSQALSIYKDPALPITLYRRLTMPTSPTSPTLAIRFGTSAPTASN